MAILFYYSERVWNFKLKSISIDYTNPIIQKYFFYMVNVLISIRFSKTKKVHNDNKYEGPGLK